MRILALLVLAAGLAAADAAAPTVATVAGLELTIPAGFSAVEPPIGTVGCWRSANGLAAISVVARESADGDQIESQVADLMALGQDLTLEHHGALDQPAGWHRVRYQLDLGEARYAQDARIARVGGKQVVVVASWPVAEAARWDAALTAVLDALPAASR